MTIYYADFDLVTGNNDGSDWANAWQTMADAIAGSNGTPPAAGDTIYTRGTDTITSDTTNALNGDETNGLIKWIGVNGSGINDGTRTVLDGNSNNVRPLNLTGGYQLFENFECKNSGDDSGFVVSGSDNVFINCSGNNNSSHGFNINNGTRNWFTRCCAYSNSLRGYYAYTYNKFIFCSAHDNSQDGWLAQYMGYGDLIACLSYDNGQDGIENFTNNVLAFNCVIEANDGHGIKVNSGTGRVAAIIGNRITNHSGSGDIGLDAQTEIILYGWNYFEDNDGDNVQNVTLAYALTDDGSATNVEDQADTNEGYTSKTDGSEDFNLRSDASLRRVAISIPTV